MKKVTNEEFDFYMAGFDAGRKMSEDIWRKEWELMRAEAVKYERAWNTEKAEAARRIRGWGEEEG